MTIKFDTTVAPDEEDAVLTVDKCLVMIAALEAQVEDLGCQNYDMKRVIEGLMDTYSRAYWESFHNDGKGMQVPYHGDFQKGSMTPSVWKQLKWWIKELTSAADIEFNQDFENYWKDK
jgi:hypothetical protein